MGHLKMDFDRGMVCKALEYFKHASNAARILVISAPVGGCEEPRFRAWLRGLDSRRETGCAAACEPRVVFESSRPYGETEPAIQRGRPGNGQSGRQLARRPQQYGRRFQRDRLALFACRGGGSP